MEVVLFIISVQQRKDLQKNAETNYSLHNRTYHRKNGKLDSPKGIMRDTRSISDFFMEQKEFFRYGHSLLEKKKVKMEKFDTSKVHFPYQNLHINLVENIHNSKHL